MKKAIILIFIIISIAAIIPIIGNKFIDDTLQTQIDRLKSKGITIKNSSENISYLNTSKHYEFLVEDTEKFLNYLSKYSTEQLPPYTDALLVGTLVGVDLEYSNIPLSEDVSLDIYPLALSQNITNELRNKDEDFTNYIEKYLLSKGILYHIDYNIVSTDFKGFIKDVDENYTLKNNAKVVLNIANTNFEGNGDLIAPSYLKLFSKKIMFKILNPHEEISVDVNNFISSLKFEDKNTYMSSAQLDSFLINFKAPNRKRESIDVSNINLSISSNTQAEKAELHSKISFKNMNLKLKNSDLNASSFHYDIAITGIDKQMYEELRVLLSKTKTTQSQNLDADIKHAIIKLVSKGVEIDIVDLSLGNINLDGNDLRGFKVASELKVREDKNLATKMMLSPLFILPNIDLDFKSTTSQKILNEIVANLPIPISLVDYSKSTGDDAVLDILYKQGSLTINGKSILN